MLHESITYNNAFHFLEDYENYLKHNALLVKLKEPPALLTPVQVTLHLFPEGESVLLQGKVINISERGVGLSLDEISPEQIEQLRRVAEQCRGLVGELTEPEIPIPTDVLEKNSSHLTADDWELGFSSGDLDVMTLHARVEIPATAPSGAEPTSLGAEPTSSGAESTSLGAESKSLDAEPTSLSAEPTSLGAESSFATPSPNGSWVRLDSKPDESEPIKTPSGNSWLSSARYANGAYRTSKKQSPPLGSRASQKYGSRQERVSRPLTQKEPGVGVKPLGSLSRPSSLPPQASGAPVFQPPPTTPTPQTAAFNRSESWTSVVESNSSRSWRELNQVVDSSSHSFPEIQDMESSSSSDQGLSASTQTDPSDSKEFSSETDSFSSGIRLTPPPLTQALTAADGPLPDQSLGVVLPESASGSAAEESGDLVTTPILALLHSLHQRKVNGYLEVVCPDRTMKTYWYRGEVMVVKTIPEDESTRLGQIFVREGKVEMSEIDSLLQDASNASLPLGESLLEKKRITKRSLGLALLKQMQIRLGDFFSETQGTYKFWSSRMPNTKLVGPPTSPMHLLLQNEKNKLKLEMEEATPEQVSQYLHPTDFDPELLTCFGFSEKELQAFRELITGKYRLREVFSLSSLRRNDTFLLVCVCENLGLLTFEREKREDWKILEMGRRLESQVKKIGQVQPLAFLGLSDSSNQDELDNAYRKIRDQFNLEENNSAEWPEEFHTMSRKIISHSKKMRNKAKFLLSRASQTSS